MKVLLVDDEKFAIEGLTKLLNWDSFCGELVGTAANGKDALETIETVQPDVIISDIKMPILDGIGLAQAVSENHSHIHIILLSGHGDFEYAQKAIRYGVSEYILKPITREKITQLENILKKLCIEREQKKSTYLNAWDTRQKNEIISALKHNNRSFFDSFFLSDQFISSMKADTCNPVGIQFLNYYYEFLSEMNHSQESIAHNNKKSIEHYLDLPNIDEKKNYIITKYYDILTEMNNQSHANIDTISIAAQSFVKANFSNSSLSISLMADELNVSISYLSSVFKQTTGGNLSDYIMALRLGYAKELLGNLKYGINDIAALSGYNDAKYFAKLFKRKTGMTPSEYRNIHVQGKNSLQKE